MTRARAATYGPNSASVQAVLDQAAGMLPGEAETMAATMISMWSWGRTDSRFPPFVAALGAACHASVSSGRLAAFRAARGAVSLPPATAWDRSSPVALVGVRVTAMTLVVADVLTAEQRALLLRPWRALTTARPRTERGVA